MDWQPERDRREPDPLDRLLAEARWPEPKPEVIRHLRDRCQSAHDSSTSGQSSSAMEDDNASSRSSRRDRRRCVSRQAPRIEGHDQRIASSEVGTRGARGRLPCPWGCFWPPSRLPPCGGGSNRSTRPRPCSRSRAHSPYLVFEPHEAVVSMATSSTQMEIIRSRWILGAALSPTKKSSKCPRSAISQTRSNG